MFSTHKAAASAVAVDAADGTEPMRSRNCPEPASADLQSSAISDPGQSSREWLGFLRAARGSVRSAVGIALISSSLCTLGGCWAREQNSPPEPVVDNIQPDPAMDLRQWSQTSAFYTNTTVVSGPTGYFWRPKAGLPGWEVDAIDVPLWFYDVIRSPVSAIQIPPGTKVYNRGATVEPTYTGAPPLTPLKF